MVFLAFGLFRRSAGDDATPSVSVCIYPRVYPPTMQQPAPRPVLGCFVFVFGVAGREQNGWDNILSKICAWCEAEPEE